MKSVRLLVLAIAAATLLGCGADPTNEPPTPEPTSAPTTEPTTQPTGGQNTQRYPDVVDATVTRTEDTFEFAVTISSPYDSPERYADGWRIKGPDGTGYGVHTLGHHHASEQPFTRTQTGVSIPDHVREVIVEGRDSLNGYGGATKTVQLP